MFCKSSGWPGLWLTRSAPLRKFQALPGLVNDLRGRPQSLQVVPALGFKDLEALAHPGNEAGMHTANPDQRKKAGQARTNRALANREVPPRYLTLKPALQTKHTVGRKDIYIYNIYNASSDLHAINQMCVPTLFRQVTQAEPRSCVPGLDRFIGLLLLTILGLFLPPSVTLLGKEKE